MRGLKEVEDSMLGSLSRSDTLMAGPKICTDFCRQDWLTGMDVPYVPPAGRRPEPAH